MHFWIFCRKRAFFCRKSSGELQKTCKNLQKTKNRADFCRFSAEKRLQACRFWFFATAAFCRKCRKPCKNCRKSRFVCKTSNRIALRALFGLQSPLRAGKPARRIHMEKSVIPCGASPQEWGYIDALGADCRYIVPIVSNPDIQGIGALLRVQKTRGRSRASKTPRGA